MVSCHCVNPSSLHVQRASRARACITIDSGRPRHWFDRLSASVKLKKRIEEKKLVVIQSSCPFLHIKKAWYPTKINQTIPDMSTRSFGVLMSTLALPEGCESNHVKRKRKEIYSGCMILTQMYIKQVTASSSLLCINIYKKKCPLIVFVQIL